MDEGLLELEEDDQQDGNGLWGQEYGGEELDEDQTSDVNLDEIDYGV